MNERRSNRNSSPRSEPTIFVFAFSRIQSTSRKRRLVARVFEEINHASSVSRASDGLLYCILATPTGLRNLIGGRRHNESSEPQHLIRPGLAHQVHSFISNFALFHQFSCICVYGMNRPDILAECGMRTTRSVRIESLRASAL